MHLLSFLYYEMVDVMESHANGRQGPVLFYVVNTVATDDVVTSGHQRLQYWPNSPRYSGGLGTNAVKDW